MSTPKKSLKSLLVYMQLILHSVWPLELSVSARLLVTSVACEGSGYESLAAAAGWGRESSELTELCIRYSDRRKATFSR